MPRRTSVETSSERLLGVTRASLGKTQPSTLCRVRAARCLSEVHREPQAAAGARPRPDVRRSAGPEAPWRRRTATTPRLIFVSVRRREALTGPLTWPLTRLMFPRFPRFFGLSWETSTLKNYHPEDSKHSGSRRIEFSSKSTTFLM